MQMNRRVRIAAALAAVLVVAAIAGFFLTSSWTGNSDGSQANGGSSNGLPTKTVDSDCYPDTDNDGEAVEANTNTFTASGTVTVATGQCVIDNDEDGN